MVNYRFSLDKSSKKFLCPSCNKRRFVRYWDSEDGEYLSEDVGRCDRQVSCGHHHTPKEYFLKKPQVKDALFKKTDSKNLQIMQPSASPDFVNPAFVGQTMKYYESNRFIMYLRSLFEDELTQKLIQQFKIGTSAKWGRSGVIFWQIDANLQPRSGKIMLYNSNTGKRVKTNGKPQIDWVHAILKRTGKMKKFNLKQCLFGEHQIASNLHADKYIAIVESEKTAILMTAIYPQFLWMACGSVNNLKASIFERLAGRKIILYPDLGCFELWSEKMKELKLIGFQIRISDLLEKNTSEEQQKDGLDCADFFIQRDDCRGWALTDQGYPLFWDSPNGHV